MTKVNNMPITEALISSLSSTDMTSHLISAIERGLSLKMDHFSAMGIAYTAKKLDEAVMAKIITAWCADLKSVASTAKLARVLDKYSEAFARYVMNQHQDVSFANTVSSMLTIERKLTNNSGALNQDLLTTLQTAWVVELMRLVGTDEEFESASNASIHLFSALHNDNHMIES